MADDNNKQVLSATIRGTLEDGVTPSAEAMENSLNSVANATDQVSASMETVNQKVTVAGKSVNATLKQWDDLTSNQMKLDAAAKGVANTTTLLAQAQATGSDKADALTRALDNQKNAQTALQEKVDTIKTAIAGAGESMDDLGGSVTRAASKIGDLGASFSELANIQKVLNELNGTKLGTNLGQFAADATATANTLNTLRASVDKVYASSMAYEGQLAKVDALEQTNALTAQRATSIRELLTEAFAKGSSATAADTAILQAQTEAAEASAKAQAEVTAEVQRRAQATADLAASSAKGQATINAFAGVTTTPLNEQGGTNKEDDAQDAWSDAFASADKDRAAVDALFQSSTQYAAALDNLDSLVKRGIISDEQRVVLANELTDAYAKQNSVLSMDTILLDQATQAAEAKAAADRDVTEEVKARAAAEAQLVAATATSSANVSAFVAQGSTPTSQAVQTNASVPDVNPRQADFEAAANEADKLRASLDPLYSLTTRYNQALADLASLQEQGVISEEQQILLGQQQANLYSKLIANMNEYGQSSGQTGYLIRNLGIQGSQSISGLLTGQGAMQVLLQQGHQVIDVFLASGSAMDALGEIAKKVGGFLISPLGVIIEITAAVGALGYAAEAQNEKLAKLTQGLQGSSDHAAALAKEITAAAKAAADAHVGLSQTDATTAATSIASNTNFGGTTTQLTQMVELANRVAQSFGTTVPDAAKTLAGSLSDPLAAATKLNEMGFKPFNETFLEYIAGLDRAGHQTEATQLVLETLAGSLKSSTEVLTPLQQAWRDLTQAVTGTDGSLGDLAKGPGQVIIGVLTQQIDSLTRIVNLLHDSGQAFDQSWFGRILTYQLPPWLNNALMNPGVALGINSAPASATYGPVQNATLDTSHNMPQASMDALTAAIGKYDLDAQSAQVLIAIAHAESGGHQYVNDDPSQGLTTSSTGAIGLGQIMPINHQQLLNQGYTDVDTTTLQGNANATAIDVKNLMAQFHSDAAIVVAAFNAGAGRAQKYIDGKEALPAESVNEAKKVTGVDLSVTGTRSTLAGSAATSAANSGSDFSGPGVLNTQGIVDNTKALTAQEDALLKSIDAQNPWAASILKGGQNVERLTALLNSGKLTTDQAAAAVEVLGKAQEALLSPQDKAARSAQEQTAALADMNPVQRELNQLQLEALNAARAQGDATANQTDLDIRQVEAKKQLAQQYALGTDAILKQLSSQNAINAAFDGTAKTTQHATNYQTALNEAYTKFSDVNAPAAILAIKARTAALDEGNKVAGEAQTDQDIIKQQQDIDLIKLETSTLGENTVQRQKEIDLLNARNVLLSRGQDLNAKDSQAYLANVNKLADTKAIYDQQQANLGELTSFATNSFQTIGNSITQALENGSTKALNFGTIMKSVASQIVTEFLKLAILNPLLNGLFGQNTPTLGGVVGTALGLATKVASGSTGGVVGAAGSTAGAAGSGGFGTDLTVLGAAKTIGGYLFPGVGGAVSSAVNGAINSVFGTTLAVNGVIANTGAAVAGGVGSGIADLATSASTVGGTIIGGVGSAVGVGADVATSGAVAGGIIGAGAGAAEGIGSAGISVAADGLSTAAAATTGVASAANSAAGALSSAASAVSSYVPFIGAGIGILTNILSGNYIGAALVAGGAAIGTIILPGIGTAIGAAIGEIGALFTGKKKPNSFESTDVGNQDGFISLSHVQQQANKDTTNFNNLVTQASALNTDLANTGIRVAGGDNSNMFNVGYGVKNDANFYDSLKAAFPALRFKAADDDNDTYKQVANADLDGKSFTGQDTLDAAIKDIQTFTTTLMQYGVTVSNVQKDLAGFTVKDVGGYADDNLNTALDSDLKGKTFTSMSDLTTEITKVQTFVETTMPGLVSATGDAQSQFIAQQQQIDTTYSEAEAQAKSYGLSIDALTATQAKLQAKLLDTAKRAIQDNDNSYVARIDANQGDTLDSSLIGFDQQANQQRTALHDLFVSYYGEASLTTQDYLTQQAHLETALGQDRLKIQTDYNAQIAAAALQQTQAIRGIDETVSSAGSDNLRQDAAIKDEPTYGPDYLQADLIDFDNQAYDKVQKLSQDMIATYGASVVNSAGYAHNMAVVELDLSNSRIAIQKKYADQATAAAVQAAQTQAAAVKQAQDTATQAAISSLSSLQQYATKLQTGSMSALDPNHQYSVAMASFNSDATSALKGNAASISSLSGYADTLLSTSQVVNGSGTQYAADFQRVLNVIGQISQINPDTLTATIYVQQQEDLADQLKDALKAVKDAVDAVNTQLKNQAAAPARVTK